MRSLFFIVLLANVALFAYGTGAFGDPPGNEGRDPARLQQQTSPQSLSVSLTLPRLPESAPEEPS